MWVEKPESDPSHIHAYCVAGDHEEIFISGWLATDWAGGMMDPVSASDLKRSKVLQ